MKHKKSYTFHGLIEKEGDGYFAICLELDVATEGDTIKQAEANLREAVELYLEDVYADGDEKDFIPRPAPREYWLKYFASQERERRKAGSGRKKPELELQFQQAVNAG